MATVRAWLDDLAGRAQAGALIALRRAQTAHKQRKYVGQYVAVTGSCGKTTTTMLTGALLARFGSARAGIEANSGLHMLRTVRKLHGPVDFAVQETSGSRPGAIDFVTKALRIDVAVITSVGLDHGSNFRAPGADIRDAVAREKGKLVEAVAPGGLACLNFDDVRVRAMAARTRQKVVGFGASPDAEVRAINVEAHWPGRLRFDLIVAGKTYPVVTRFVGTMMLTNILGALAVVHGLGLDLEPAIAELATIDTIPDRMGVHAGRDGKTYIRDTLKAAFWSTEMLVEDLPRMQIEGLTFVLGDLSDNHGAGSGSSRYRRLIRVLAPRVETLVLSGLAAEWGAKVIQEGIPNIVVAPSAFEVSQYLDTRPPGVVLLKANKTSQLWRVLDQVTPFGEGEPADNSRASS